VRRGRPSRGLAGAALAVTTLAAVLAAGALAVGAAAPAAESFFGERIDVEVVNVDVVVTDARRRPVLDLRREEFELLVDERAVEIEYFGPPTRRSAEPPAAGPEPAAAAAPAVDPELAVDTAPPPPPPTLVVYVDQTALKHSRRNEALQGVARFLEQRFPKNGRVMVVVFDRALHLLTPLTSDRKLVRRALEQAERELASGQMARLEEEALAREIGRVDLGDARMSPADQAARIAAEIDRRADEEATRQRNATRALAGLIGALDGVEGRKVVLLATAGFRTRPAAGLADVWRARFGDLGVPPPRAGNVLDDRSANLQREFTRLLRAAQAARVTVFAVDGSESSALAALDPSNPGMLEVDEALGAGTAELEQSGNMSILALSTGGRVFRSSPELGDRLAVVVDDVEGSYSLGFSVGPEARGGFHRIEVKVRRPGLRVRHREGFRRRDPGERVGDAVVATAAFGEHANPMGIDAQVGKPRRQGRGTLVPLAVRVPLRALTLVPQGDRHSLQVSFHFAVRTHDDRLVELEARELTVDVEAAKLPAALRQHLTYNVELPLAPGSHQVAVGVHDRIGGARSTLLVPVVVPGRR
jgi:VWFA-related protein